MSSVKVAKHDSPLEKAMQQIEEIMEANDICIDDVGVITHKGRSYVVRAMDGGSSGSLPRFTDCERFVAVDSLS